MYTNTRVHSEHSATSHILKSLQHYEQQLCTILKISKMTVTHVNYVLYEAN